MLRFFDQIVDLRLARQIRLAQLPQPSKGRVAQLEATIRPDQRNTLIEIVERAALDLDQRVVLCLHGQPIGDILIGEHQTTQGVW